MLVCRKIYKKSFEVIQENTSKAAEEGLDDIPNAIVGRCLNQCMPMPSSQAVKSRVNLSYLIYQLSGIVIKLSLLLRQVRTLHKNVIFFQKGAYSEQIILKLLKALEGHQTVSLNLTSCRIKQSHQTQGAYKDLTKEIVDHYLAYEKQDSLSSWVFARGIRVSKDKNALYIRLYHQSKLEIMLWLQWLEPVAYTCKLKVFCKTQRLTPSITLSPA